MDDNLRTMIHEHGSTNEDMYNKCPSRATMLRTMRYICNTAYFIWIHMGNLVLPKKKVP